jgi:hypothetical protein
MPAFQLAMLGGPWQRRLRRRRGWIDRLPWREALPDDADARVAWTRTAFSEYASAAAFAEIAAALLAAGAPIDLIAAAGDIVVDEIVHTEAAARIAAALGTAGPAVALEVDLTRLVRPATPEAAGDPLLRAAELVVRTACVGEALTVPMLKLARDTAGSPLIEAALAAIVSDEAGHAQLGWWFLDWAAPQLDDAARAVLGRAAGGAIRSFAPLLGGSCRRSTLGAVACDRYDATLVGALPRAVVRPLALRGIAIPPADLAAVEAGEHGACGA